jgi:hypothetical protein
MPTCCTISGCRTMALQYGPMFSTVKTKCNQWQQQYILIWWATSGHDLQPLAHLARAHCKSRWHNSQQLRSPELCSMQQPPTLSLACCKKTTRAVTPDPDERVMIGAFIHCLDSLLWEYGHLMAHIYTHWACAGTSNVNNETIENTVSIASTHFFANASSADSYVSILKKHVPLHNGHIFVCCGITSMNMLRVWPFDWYTQHDRVCWWLAAVLLPLLNLVLLGVWKVVSSNTALHHWWLFTRCGLHTALVLLCIWTIVRPLFGECIQHEWLGETMLSSETVACFSHTNCASFNEGSSAWRGTQVTFGWAHAKGA